MGATSIYKCSQCGYTTDEIDEWPGLFSPVAFKAFLCPYCQSIVSKRTDENWNLTEEDNQCNYCHGANLISWDDMLCPRCRGQMSLECVGLWD